KFEGTTIQYDAEKKLIWFDTWKPPTPSEFEKIRKLLPEETRTEGTELTETEKQQEELRADFLKQLKRLEDLSKRLSYKQKLAAQLKGDPNVTGVVQETERKPGQEEWQMRSTPEKPSEYVVRVGERELYKEMIADYNQKLAVADQDYEFDHLASLWGKIQQKKNELVGPVKALEKSLEQDALKILNYEQLTKGAVPPEMTPIRKIDMLTIYCLIGFGICLMCGFATRLVAIAAAGMLLSFYGVWPPWPGVPEAPGPEHALLINKNIIEAIALMAIALLPTGTWFGVDGALGWLFHRKRSK
ncbi:MAG TPA: DoxX family protein, partial [Planctomycetaceae bacterium]|nr:DoxX family protein [Planctomycetaceae bacterium]